MSRDPSSRSARVLGAIVAFCILLILLVLLWPKGDHKDHDGHGHSSGDHAKHSGDAKSHGLKRAPFTKPLREGDPEGIYFHMFDKAKNANRFLLSREGYKDLLPDSDAPTGMDLRLRNEDGTERLVAESVVRAKFSPDGTKIAFTTSDATMHIEGVNGEKIATVPRGYDPDWRADSKEIVFSQGPEGKPPNMPETLKITTYDVETGEMKDLTHGGSDDVRPHYGPNDCIVFVNGGRTGLASFWRVCNGGEPEQITNLGQQDVTEKFVPTPYMRSGWSPDKRWFVYDFKNGDVEETWGIEFDSKGNPIQTKKIGNGLDPQFQSDGSLVSLISHGEKKEPTSYTLPSTTSQ